MAFRLTPFAKILISLVVLTGAAAAAWQLGLRDVVHEKFSEATTPTEGVASNTSPTQAQTNDAAIGTAKNPLKVSIVSFHGYAPALVANGNSLRTKAGSLFAQKGVDVEFIIQDDIPTLATIFEAGTAHCAWRTSDFWAQEQPNLRNNKLDARAIMIVDNTQGADAIISREPGVNRVEDLAGK